MDFDMLKKKIFASKDKALQKEFEQDNLMDEFMDKLNRINYFKSQGIDELEGLAEKIDNLYGWPKNPQKFWDLEAAFWERRIDQKTKRLIADEIKKCVSGNILNIGAGSFPYVDSINIDISFEMLEWNSSEKKVQADACFMPFKDNSFDSAVAAFVANYIRDLDLFIAEIKRVLKNNSSLIFVQGKKINPLHRLAENKLFSVDKLTGLLRNSGFTVRNIEKESMIFLRCRKVK